MTLLEALRKHGKPNTPAIQFHLFRWIYYKSDLEDLDTLVLKNHRMEYDIVSCMGPPLSE